MNLSDIARANPDKAAVIMADGSRSITFAELDERSRRLADYLAEKGLRRGDHLALLMGNRPEFIEISWAAQRSGLLYTPINWHLTEGEAGYVADDCGARALVVGDDVSELAVKVLTQAPQVDVALAVGADVPGYGSYREVVAEEHSDTVHEPIEGYYFFYSSGTTGRPKGIEPVHSFPPFGTGLRLDIGLGPGYGVNSDSVYLCPAPLYHAAPLGWTLGVQRYGASVVLMESFDPIACLEAIEKYGVTHAQFVPTMFVRLLKLPEEVRNKYDLSSLQTIVHAGAPCPVPVKQQMIEWLGPILIEYYAGSEGGGMTYIRSEEWLKHPGSVGKAIYGTLHILDEDGNELPPGVSGSVYFGDTESFSYHNDPEKTASTRSTQGWHTIGDLGYVDEDGYLFLSDRRSDLIISGGVNIYPQEIESALIMHPSVTDVAVIGLDNTEFGQSVHAVVQLRDGIEPSEAVESELSAFARTQLAGFKCPRSLSFVEVLPRTPTGKLLRRKVREQSG